MIASFAALTAQNPRRNKIHSHTSSIIPGNELNGRISDKVEKWNKERRNKDQYLPRRKKEDKNEFPIYKCLLYFTFKIALKKLPHNKLTIK